MPRRIIFYNPAEIERLLRLAGKTQRYRGHWSRPDDLRCRPLHIAKAHKSGSHLAKKAKVLRAGAHLCAKKARHQMYGTAGQPAIASIKSNMAAKIHVAVHAGSKEPSTAKAESGKVSSHFNASR